MPESVYVLDANVFIQAKNQYYAFDLTPRFWQLLVELAQTGRIVSIDRVRAELERGKDELATWAKADFSDGFASTDEDDVIESYREIMNWVMNETQFFAAAKAGFARGADGWLVAYARVKKGVVVTQEMPHPPEVKARIPIPNVCQQFGVSFVNTFEMLRRLGVRWSH